MPSRHRPGIRVKAYRHVWLSEFIAAAFIIWLLSTCSEYPKEPVETVEIVDQCEVVE